MRFPHRFGFGVAALIGAGLLAAAGGSPGPTRAVAAAAPEPSAIYPVRSWPIVPGSVIHWTGPGMWIPAGPAASDAPAVTVGGQPVIGVWVAVGRAVLGPGCAPWPGPRPRPGPLWGGLCGFWPRTVLVTTATRVAPGLRPGFGWAQVTARPTVLPAVDVAVALAPRPAPRPPRPIPLPLSPTQPVPGAPVVRP